MQFETREYLPVVFGAPIGTGVGSAPDDVAIADFNGDGKLDFMVTNGNGSDADLRVGNGDGTFRQISGPFTTLATPWDVRAADFNGDGKMDAAVANFNSAGLTVLLGDGTGNFSGSNYSTTGNCG
jgi:hypothetical protein